MKTIHLKLPLVIFLILLLNACSETVIEGPYFTTGVKIGEVTQTEAIVWARLTENPERVGNDALMPDIKYKDPETGQLIERRGRPDTPPVVTYPDGYTVDNIQGATPGSEGWVRLKYKIQDEGEWVEIDWQAVDPQKAFTYQFQLSGLTAGETYELLAEASPDGKNVSASIEGSFKTPAPANVPAEVNFIVTTGTSYPDVDSESGYKIYLNSLKLDPEFFVHTGDIVY